MLKPFDDYIPQLLKENIDTAGQAFVDNVEYWRQQWIAMIAGIDQLALVEKCPAVLLPELAAYYSVPIYSSDSDQVKRQRIFRAVKSHKKKGRWVEDVKIKVDLVAGGDSELFYPAIDSQWVLMGGPMDLTPYMAYLGTAGGDHGMWLMGSGTEPNYPGNIYIDCDNSGLTAEEVGMIVRSITDDSYLAYFRIYLGYTTAGVFTAYAGGVI